MNYRVTPPTPTEGFSFPESAHDAIDRKLREAVDEPLRSVRPNRQPRVTPSLVEDDADAPYPTQPSQQPTVATVNPPTTPKTEPEGISIELPFKFHYYTFKDLYVKPMRVPQLAKMSKAHTTGSLQTQAEAISSLLSTSNSDDKDIAFKLTMADYTAVLYYLRLTSFSKPQMRITSTCDNPAHVQAVMAGEKPKNSLTVVTQFTKTDLKVNFLEQAPDPAYYNVVVDGVTIYFRPETLADTIQFLDHKDWADEAFQYKSRIAAVLGLEEATGKPWTWDQRIRFVDEVLTPDQALLAIEFADMLDTYGIVESVKTKCTGCGSEGVTQVTCDPLSFLSPKF